MLGLFKQDKLGKLPNLRVVVEVEDDLAFEEPVIWTQMYVRSREANILDNLFPMAGVVHEAGLIEESSGR